MKESDGRDWQIATLRDRLSRLSDASLRDNESLDLEMSYSACRTAQGC